MQIMVNGQLVQYKDEGKGPVIVLLHGWGANLASFDGIVTYLSTQFRVIRFDFPGFGGSPKPADSWGVSEYAQLTAGVLAKLNIRIIFAFGGHSFGGRVIIKGVADKILSSEKVILIDTAGIRPRSSARKNILKVVAKTGKVVTSLPGLRTLRPALRKKLYTAAGTTDYLEADAMQKIFLNTINEDLLPIVSSITQPTLLIWGENDTETPVSDAYMLMNELVDGELLVVPEAGHFVYIDDPLAVQRALEAFLL
jgi:pimeloyl-ACP methyl ester carboxylesterase